VEQRPIDEPRPDVEHVDQLSGKAREAPRLIRVHDARLVTLEEAAIEVDHAADELRRERAHAAVIEQVDPRRPAVLLEDGIIAEMRITMDHAVMAEGIPPRAEH